MTETAAADLDRLSREIIKTGSKSFAAASRLFDPERRVAAQLLYAWCRHCDDVVDGQQHGFFGTAQPRSSEASRRELELLRQQTADALAGKRMTDPVFHGFQLVMRRYDVPARHALEHLDGFAMDVEGRRYATAEELLTYCYRVAGVVGVMMAMIMGVRDRLTLDRASDLGLAFQLSNIARDIYDDARAGRCYLPTNWLAEAGVSEVTLLDVDNRDAVFAVASRLIALAERYYDSSRVGIAQLPLRSAWAVGTARAVYREIGREVLRRGSGAWAVRISTSNVQKAKAVLGGGAVALMTRIDKRTPPRSGLWSRPLDECSAPLEFLAGDIQPGQ